MLGDSFDPVCGVGRRNRVGPRTSEFAGILGPFFFVVAAAVAVVALAAEPVHWLLQRLCYSIGCGMDVCGQTELVSILRG